MSCECWNRLCDDPVTPEKFHRVETKHFDLNQGQNELTESLNQTSDMRTVLAVTAC